MGKNKKQKVTPQTIRRSTQQLSQNKHATRKQPEPTIPFGSEERILLVGDGDFSFAKSIVEHHGCCDLTATSYDSQEALYEKYNPQAKNHVDFLEDEGQAVLYSVDATAIEKHKQLKGSGRYDRIIFNFPHVGGKSKDVNRQVRFNQELLVKFFASASAFLTNDGTIIVTLFEGEPYTLWNVKDLARHSGLTVLRSFAFVAEAYPGYSHARTLGNIEGGGGWKGEDRKARSYIFELKSNASKSSTRPAAVSGQKRKRAADSDSDND